MNDEWQSLPTETLYRALGALKDEPQTDPWHEILELARIDPCCQRAVDCVRYNQMTKEEAALWLAVYQTKLAMELHERACELLRSMPSPYTVLMEKMVAPQPAGD